MKHLVIIIALLATLTASAQQERPAIGDLPRNTVMVSFLGPVISTPTLSYERRVADRWSVLAHASGVIMRNADIPDAVSLALDARWYFGYSYPMQFFLEGGIYGIEAWLKRDVFVGNDGYDIHTEPYTYSDLTLRPSLMAGFRLQNRHGFVAEMRIGMLPGKEGHSLTTYARNRTLVTNYLGVKLGYAF